MQKIITGKAYVLGDNVDTDQIIPAQYLTFNPAIPEEYKQFGKYALSSVPPAQAGLPKGHVPFHTADEFVSDYKLIVAGKNFGCGSSREHAPIALRAAGVEAVVAEFYARIFYRNAVNGGHLVPFECEGRLGAELLTIRHGVTRFRITMVCFEARRTKGKFCADFYTAGRWLKPGELASYPVSAPQRRLIRALTEPGQERQLF